MTSVPMDNVDSPLSSDSAHTPLQDEHIIVPIESPDKLPNNCEVNDLAEMAEEQLDYEDFVENAIESKGNSEAEDGECDSDDNIVEANTSIGVPIENTNEVSLNTNIVADTVDINNTNVTPTSGDLKNIQVSHIVETKEELAEGELKAEEEEPPAPETPWERGLRLARERRELAKQKKVQEKDKLKERQLNINLDGVEEVEPISKPPTSEVKELNPKLLKALQPIVILAEEPKEDEMTLEYYLAESDYQHRPRFIPSKLYTLDPWEVDEWKRELDMIKFENEMASSKMKRSGKRMCRRSSGSSYASSRSSSPAGGRMTLKSGDGRAFEHHTSQYAIGRQRPLPHAPKRPQTTAAPAAGVPPRHRRRDLPPEFQNRVPSSSRSSSRSSSGGSHSSSGSSSSSSSSSSHSSRASARPARAPAAVAKATVPRPALQGLKKPALGRARSNSSASSASSGSSSSGSSGSSSSRSSGSSGGAAGPQRQAARKKTDKQFISSWVGRARPSNLASTVVAEAGIPATRPAPDRVEAPPAPAQIAMDSTAPGSELPSATSRPGVKLKLVARPKPVMMPQAAQKKSSKPGKDKEKPSKKEAGALRTADKERPATSGIFGSSQGLLTALARAPGRGGPPDHGGQADPGGDGSERASSQLQIQQEFLRTYKDKIAIYRSQLSYQQQQQRASGGLGGQGGPSFTGTLTHGQPPPLRGPITVMAVTSKKTGPPRAAVRVADHYSRDEEQMSRRARAHRGDARSRSRSHGGGGGENGHYGSGGNYGSASRGGRHPGNSGGERGRDGGGYKRPLNESNRPGAREAVEGGRDRDRDRHERGPRGGDQWEADRPRHNYRADKEERPRAHNREAEARFPQTASNRDGNNRDRDRGERRPAERPPRSRSPRKDRENNVSANVQEEVVVKSAMLPIVPAAVPKEKRREELLKQLKAVEDAIAKKKAKIDK